MATPLQNFRVEADLWADSGTAAKAHGTDRSKILRERLEREVSMDGSDPVWTEVLRLARERGTTVEHIEREAVAAYLETQRAPART